MRRHVLRWVRLARCSWHRHCTTLTAVPDPHGQFPALPLDWYLRDSDQPDSNLPDDGDNRENRREYPRIPEQRTGRPHRHPGHRR
jgi:hypothetical protein